MAKPARGSTTSTTYRCESTSFRLRIAFWRESPSRTSMLRIAGTSAVVRTKLAGASAPGVACCAAVLAEDGVLPDDAHATSTQASRSGGRRMPQYTTA